MYVRNLKYFLIALSPPICTTGSQIKEKKKSHYMRTSVLSIAINIM